MLKNQLTIVCAHNYYQSWGGEDAVFESNAKLLEDRGHRIHRYAVRNDQIKTMNRLRVAAGTVWRRTAVQELQSLFREVRPDVIYFNNTFPLISPAAYYAAAAENIPVVQRLPNFRLLCAGATFYRDGAICERCLGKVLPVPAVANACYRESAAGSAVVGTMQVVHRILGSWKKKVDQFVAPSNFARLKFIEGGLPEARVEASPNTVPDPGYEGDRTKARKALFVGRLVPEKGLGTLLEAWAGVDAQLEIIGDGPLMSDLRGRAPPNVRFLGQIKDQKAIIRAMRNCQFLAVPSEWYEVFGLVAIEAFSVGIPVLASRLGGLAEIIDEGETGLYFEPGNVADLTEKLRWAFDHPDEVRQMGRNAREVYLKKYTPEVGYQNLMTIYERVIEESGRRRSLLT